MPAPRPTVVVLGKIDEVGHKLLEQELNVVYHLDLTEDSVIQVCQSADAILWRNHPRCSERVMASCSKVQVIGRYGAGYDVIDVEAATKHGIVVVNAKGANDISAAEHTIMLMLSCAKMLRKLDQKTRLADWSVRTTGGISELYGKYLGIIGVGSIGRKTAALAQAFGMKVIGFDPYLSSEQWKDRKVEDAKSLEQLLALSDFVSCHVPLTEETRNMINADRFRQMKNGVFFINTSRGPVVNEKDLFDALTSHKIGVAGIDVWEKEPISKENPILKLENVICTPHVAGLSDEANRTIATVVATDIIRVLQGEQPNSFVNPGVWPRRRLGAHGTS